ncbi:hypothetical protein VIGAN_05018000, partial [Vigna angularis var. angularis]
HVIVTHHYSHPTNTSVSETTFNGSKQDGKGQVICTDLRTKNEVAVMLSLQLWVFTVEVQWVQKIFILSSE